MVVAATSDFKTIKAKVGKRAPVKANVTDTSFKSAGLHISKQVGISNNNDTAVSSATAAASSALTTQTTRSGLSLHQVLVQFQHPTIAVRISALKSFKNLFVTLPKEPYISEIISSILPICCIDDESSVRKIAIQIFYDSFVHFDTVPPSSSITTTNSSYILKSLLQPFTSYMIAMITTGLNSLDIQQQFDNTIMVRYLMEISSRNDSNIENVHQAMMQFIPPLTRLLGVVPNTTTTTATSKTVTATTNTFETGSAATATSWASNTAVPQHPMMVIGSMKKSKNNKKRKRQTQTSVSSSGGTARTTNLQHPPPHQQQQQMVQQDGSVTNGATTNPKLIVLLSIYALCRHYYSYGMVDESSSETLADLQQFDSNDAIGNTKLLPVDMSLTRSPNVTVLSQQIRRTTILFVKKNQMRHGSPILSSSSSSAIVTDHSSITSSLSFLSRNETLDLLAKVRDYMIEASQSNDSNSLLQCIMTVRYILEYYNNGCNVRKDYTTTSENESMHIIHQRCYKLLSQIGSYIVQSFRTYNSSNNVQAANNNNMAVLSRTLLCLVNTIQPILSVSSSFKSKKQESEMIANIKLWIQLISLHIQSTLEDDEATLLIATEEQMEHDADMTTSKAMLSILTELLVREDLCSYFTLRARLIELFGTVFFTKNTADDSIVDEGDKQHQMLPSHKLICSEVGRTAIMLCCRLISIQQYDIERITQFFGPTTTLNLLHSIPTHLVQYKANYLSETTLCLSTLQQIIVRMDTNANYYADILPTLRINIETLLSVNSLSTKDYCCSTFEIYPELLQRQFVCFCIVSNICTAPIMQKFANICARCYNNNQNDQQQQTMVVSVTMASFIVQSIHSIRKTLPMTVYIGFLVDSTGIMLVVEPLTISKNDDVVTRLCAIDQGARSVSSCLVSCGTSKVLPMLEPVFTILLDKMINDPTSIVFILQARSVVSHLAIFCLDLRRMNTMDNGCRSIFHYTSSEFKELVVNGIICLMSAGTVPFCDNVSAATVKRWLSPFLAIFVTYKAIFSSVVKSVLLKIPEFDSVTQGRIMEMWLNILKEPHITSMLQSEGSILLTGVIGDSKESYNKEPKNPAIQRIITELEIRCCRT